MATRRTPAEVAALVEKVKELVAGGKTIEAASEEVGISRSVYDRHVTSKKKVVVKKPKRGKIDISTLPPRPRRGGHRPPKQVDMNDVGSVAVRVARLDRKLRNVEDWVKERVELVARLLVLLKRTPKTK